MLTKCKRGIPTLNEMLADTGIPVLTEIFRESESKFPEVEPYFVAHQMFFSPQRTVANKAHGRKLQGSKSRICETTGPQFQIECNVLQSLLLQIR